MILYLTHESRDILKSFPLFLKLSVKPITKLNLGQGETFEIKIKKIGVMLCLLWTMKNLVISRRCFAEDGKEMYQTL